MLLNMQGLLITYSSRQPFHLMYFLNLRWQNFTLKKSFKALIFNFKLRGVCPLFPHVFIFEIFSFWRQFNKKFLFLSSLLLDSKRIQRGLGRAGLTTWVRTIYCGAHGRIAPSPSLVLPVRSHHPHLLFIMGHATTYNYTSLLQCSYLYTLSQFLLISLYWNKFYW